MKRYAYAGKKGEAFAQMRDWKEAYEKRRDCEKACAEKKREMDDSYNERALKSAYDDQKNGWEDVCAEKAYDHQTDSRG